MSLKNGYLAIALMSGLSLAACSNTAAGAKKDAEINADKAATAADKAEDKADRRERRSRRPRSAAKPRKRRATPAAR